MLITEANEREYPERLLIEHSCERCGCGFSSIKEAPKYCSRECYEEVLSERQSRRAAALWRDAEFATRIRSARLAAGYRKDLDAPIRARLRLAIKRAIRRCVYAGQDKAGTTLEAVGYKPDDLRRRLESLFAPGMSWANYGEWEIDHIRPISDFPLGTPVSVINALTNLQPLWKSANRKKWRHVGI